MFPTLRESLEFLSNELSPTHTVKVAIEVEQRVRKDLERDVLEYFGRGPTSVRSVEGYDFYPVAEPDILLRGRDDIIEGERVWVCNIKAPLNLIPDLPKWQSPPMLEFKLVLSEDEYRLLETKLDRTSLPAAYTVSVKRRSAYYSIPDGENFFPLEFSYDVVRSLRNAQFTEISRDLLVSADLPFRRFTTLLADIRRRGPTPELFFGLLSELGYAEDTLIANVIASHDTIVRTAVEILRGENKELDPVEVAKTQLEPRIYLDIQREEGASYLG